MGQSLAKLGSANSLGWIGTADLSKMTIVKKAANCCKFSGGAALGTTPRLHEGKISADIVAIGSFRPIRQRVQKFLNVILISLDSFWRISVNLQPLNIFCNYPIFSTLSL